KGIIGLAVMASFFSLSAAAGTDVTKDGSVNLSIAAERYDQPTLSVGLNSPTLGVYYDFAEEKFKTVQGQGLNVKLHNPSASFDSLKLKVASWSQNGHKLKLGSDFVPYDFYLGTYAGSAGTYKVPQAADQNAPFTGMVNALTDAELGAAGLGDFIGVVGGAQVDINATTMISLESTAAATQEGLYTDTAKLFVQTTWANYGS
ncbi:hypothetical protein, partial [Aeromonas sp. HMWF015]|uniref:hypothetical protein n=1 Tax=Aeromonas sp. HMWF015 TaxID=2056851 RepID=UPI000D444F8B